MIYPFIVGFISAIGQIILLRELMIELNGNEIIFSVFLSLWLLLVALGTLLFKFMKIRRQLPNLLFGSVVVFISLLPLQFFLIHLITPLFSAVSGLLINLPSIILVAFIVLAPGSLLIGFLFPLNCAAKFPRNSVEKVYIQESIGMAFGGFLFLILINFMNNLSLLIFASLFSFLLIYFFADQKKVTFIFVILFLILLFISHLFIGSYGTKYRPDKLILSQDSKYGRFDVTYSQNQQNYFWDGELIGNSENSNQAEEMVNFALLQHPQPGKILLVGGILSGYPEQIQKADSAASVDYLEIEKNIISFYRRTHPNLPSKIHFITGDPIKYFLKSSAKYDLIFIDVPDPTSLFLNRFYTREFFRTAQKHLADKNAVFICTVSNSANFLIPELARLNGVIYHTLKSVFPQVVFIPAAKVIYTAGNSEYISHNLKTLTARAQAKNLMGNWFNSALIFDVCNRTRIDYFAQTISAVKSGINRNLFPKAYLLSILFWAKHLDINLNRYFVSARNMKYFCDLFIFLLIIFLSFLFGKKRFFKLTYNIISISFVAFVLQLILIYLTQIYFGFAYLTIAVFEILFMLGLSLGFVLRKHFRLSILVLFLLTLGLTIFLDLILINPISVAVLYLLNFFIAVSEGLILAGNLAELQTKNVSTKAMKFYFLDTLGATLGGFLLGIILIPLFGIPAVVSLVMFILVGNIGVRIIDLSTKKLKL